MNILHFVNLLTSESYDGEKLKTTAKSIFSHQKYFFQMLYNISELIFEGNIFFVPKFSTKYGLIQFSLKISILIRLFNSDYNSVYMYTVFQEPSRGASIIVIASKNTSTNNKKHNWWNLKIFFWFTRKQQIHSKFKGLFSTKSKPLARTVYEFV